MPYERRKFGRTGVQWQGHATLTDGPRLPVQVVDISAGGARLSMPSDCHPHRSEYLEMTVFKRRFWPFGGSRPVCAMGRVVRVSVAEQTGRVEVGIRFHTPLSRRRLAKYQPIHTTTPVGSLATSA